MREGGGGERERAREREREREHTHRGEQSRRESVCRAAVLWFNAEREDRRKQTEAKRERGRNEEYQREHRESARALAEPHREKRGTSEVLYTWRAEREKDLEHGEHRERTVSS